MNLRSFYSFIFLVAVLLASVVSKMLSRLSEDEVQMLMKACRGSQRFTRSTEKEKEKGHFLMGGINVKQSEAPFSVHLHYSRNGIQANCAGTMISDRHVLSAAHCFIHKDCEARDVTKTLNSRGWKVYYGGGCLPFAKHACSKFQQMARAASVRSITIPNEYLTGPCMHSDIAIVTVKLKMASVNDVACVAQPEDEVPDLFTVYARGSDPSRLKTVTALAKVNLTRSRCPPEEPIPGVKDDQLCTSEWSDMNMCSGDSGSGLMYKPASGLWNIAGVASAGSDCQNIQAALFLKKKNMKLITGTELEGSIFIDVRLHNQFLCQYINLCFKRDDGAKTIKAVIL